ncbi:hypothetical protein ACM66Z_07050 [Sulfurovum sp. ST-21]|uniref:Uncharacterized protein n=1 Tax=Sulfurovum indicum TaxID=2779528 RepID=A0A7M1S4D2_9BACT|nr:hypothetical protein [Sulfurovum indicum]QOR61210.1 hypothetical protein IMZ28_07050 [Sulfurovum indicum]
MKVVQKILWWLYCILAIGIVGYFSALLGVFATDAPGTPPEGAIVIGSLIFVAGMVLFIGIPFVLWKWIKRQK